MKQSDGRGGGPASSGTPISEATEAAGDARPGRTKSPATEAPGERTRSRRWVLELALFVGVYLAISGWQERHLLDRQSPAPAFTLSSLDGDRVSSDSLRGKRVVVHFWATWCGVCQRELSALNAVQSSLAPDEVLLTIVADSDDASHVRDFVAKEHLRYPVLLGTDDVLRAFRVDTFPTNYYLDRAGRIVSHTVGMSTRWSIRARLGLM